MLLEDILPRNSFFNDFEVTHDFPQIGRRTMLLNARRLDLDDGAPHMILLAIEDVTDRQRAEAATALLAAIVNSSDDAIIGKDLAGVITSWNKSAERLFGYTAREAIGQPITMLSPPDRQQEQSEILERLKRGESVNHFETVRVTKNGSRLEISLTISPIKDAKGQIIGASKIARDITKRKRAEEALHVSEERYRTLFDFDPVAIYSCDASGVIQQFNRRAAELWGREPASGDTDERFCGSFKLFRPDGSFMPHEQCPMAEVVAGKIPAAHDAEVVIERPDGSRITVVVNIRPLKTARGEITGAINCFYDITQRKQAEEALAQSHAQLQSHAEELSRFNRAAVGRELRMIELKKEINELCQRHGEPARYPLEFEEEEEERRAMAEQSHPKDESPTALPNDSLVPLESILCTEELNRRPARPPDYETENRALAALVQALADSPRTILQTLADQILEVFQADSAGISLLTKQDGGKRFYWPAIAGAWKPHIGGGTPRDFGPCGDVLDRNAALLFHHFERRYTYFLPVTPPVEECLLVPFYVEGKAVGTIWAITHDDRRKFDPEDLRQLESLGRFASAAYQAVASLDVLEQRSEALGQSHTELAERMAELQKTNKKARESRRAALNLMEDAVQSRQAMERLNAELRESEERFRSLVSVITDVPWVMDADRRFRHTATGVGSVHRPELGRTSRLRLGQCPSPR